MISPPRRSPTKRGSHCVAPPAGTEPCSRPTWRMNASSTMTARSHAICSSLPPPTAIPLIRATVGLPISRSLSCASLNAPNHFQYSRGSPRYSADHDLRSAPTQNARPAPVSTTTRISSSQDASSQARVSSRSSRKSKALSTSGRLSVIVARGGAFSYRIDSKPSSAGASARGCVGSAKLGEHDREAAAHLHRVLAGRHELLAVRRRLEGVHVRPFPLGVVPVCRISHGRAEDPSVPERSARNLPAQLGMTLVARRLRLLVVQHDRANHRFSLVVEA